MNGQFSKLLTGALISGLLAGSAALAEDNSTSTPGAEKAVHEKNNCKKAADGKNSCKKSSGEKNGCKKSAGEKNGCKKSAEEHK